jgi:hypothetical protein
LNRFGGVVLVRTASIKSQMLTQTPFKAYPKRLSAQFIYLFFCIGAYLFALVDTWKITVNAHVSTQPLPILKLGVIAEVLAELGGDVVPI